MRWATLGGVAWLASACVTTSLMRELTPEEQASVSRSPIPRYAASLSCVQVEQGYDVQACERTLREAQLLLRDTRWFEEVPADASRDFSFTVYAPVRRPYQTTPGHNPAFALLSIAIPFWWSEPAGLRMTAHRTGVAESVEINTEAERTVVLGTVGGLLALLPGYGIADNSLREADHVKLQLAALLKAEVAAGPVIEPGRIVFRGGAVLDLPPLSVVHADPAAALERGEPIRIRRSAQVFEAGQRVVVTELQDYYEGSSERLLIYDFAGSLLHAHEPYRGPILLDASGTVFFACEMSSHDRSDTAYLVRESGERVALAFPGHLAACEQTRDRRLVVLHFFVKATGIWLTRTQVYDYSGAIVHRSDAAAARTVELDHAGVHYTVAVPQPESP